MVICLRSCGKRTIWLLSQLFLACASVTTTGLSSRSRTQQTSGAYFVLDQATHPSCLRLPEQHHPNRSERTSGPELRDSGDAKSTRTDRHPRSRSHLTITPSPSPCHTVALAPGVTPVSPEILLAYASSMEGDRSNARAALKFTLSIKSSLGAYGIRIVGLALSIERILKGSSRHKQTMKIMKLKIWTEATSEPPLVYGSHIISATLVDIDANF